MWWLIGAIVVWLLLEAGASSGDGDDVSPW
jgi:hypothetical protein